MFWLVIDPGWVLYAYAVDTVIAVPQMGSTFSLQFGFFCVIPWTGIDLFCYPQGVPYMD